MGSFFGISAWIWIAQVAYVAVALTVLSVLLQTLQPADRTQFIVLYIAAMVAVNVVWRLMLSSFLK